MQYIAVLINPVAGNGHATRAWAELKPALAAIADSVVHRYSNCPEDLVVITKELLATNPDVLLIIGGDGTLHHALNGLIKDDKINHGSTKIAYFSAGSGDDFIRSFPPQTVPEFIDRLTKSQFIQSNVGKITMPGRPPRYFINIASCGISGAIVSSIEKNKWSKCIGGTLNYLVHSLLGILRYKKSNVMIQIDNQPGFRCNMLMTAISNGAWFGGSMHVAPMADLTDGLFEVIVFREFSKWDALVKMQKIYSGKHLLEKKVFHVQAKKINIQPENNPNILLEADGECISPLPASFELLSDNLFIIV